MFAQNGLTFARRIIIYMLVVRLASIQSVQCNIVYVGCLNLDGLPSRCYSVHNNSTTHESASEECRKQQNGRLATIHSSSIQEMLSGLLNNSNNIQSAADYWIGAQMMLLERWTWLDGTTYTGHALRPDNAVHGYAAINRRDGSSNWQITTVPFNGVRQHSEALCECKLHCTEGNQYFSVPATSWFDGRKLCLENEADLAVLTTNVSSQRVNATVKENIAYFVGLSNVQLKWIHSTGTASGRVLTAANYTNWEVGAPRDENELCVVLYPVTGVWSVAHCNESRIFICEFANETAANSNTAVAYSRTSLVQTSATSEFLDSLVLTTSESTSLSKLLGNTQPEVVVAVIVLSSVLFVIIAVVAIAVCCVRTRKLNDSSRESYTGLADRNETGPSRSSNSASSGYAAISQQRPSCNNPDVCKGTPAVAETAYIDDGPQYAQVNKVRKNAPATQTAAADEYANLPQAQASAEDTKSSSRTKSAAAAVVVSASVVESSGTEYACIVPTQQQQPVITAGNNDYELPKEPVIYATVDI